MQTDPSRTCLAISLCLIVLAIAVVTTGALVGVGGGGWRPRARGHPSSLTPLSVTPTATTPSLPLTFTLFRNRRYLLYPRRRGWHGNSFTTMLSTAMTLMGGDSGDGADIDIVEGDGNNKEIPLTMDDTSINPVCMGSHHGGREAEEVDGGEISPSPSASADEDGENKPIAVHTYYHNHNQHGVEHISEDAVFDNNDGVNHMSHNLTLMGVGMPSRQFASWVHYYLTHMTKNGEAMMTPSTIITTTSTSGTAASATKINQQNGIQANRECINEILQHVLTQKFDWENDCEGDEGGEITKEEETTWLKIRQFWKEGKLICESTNLLSSPRGDGDRRRRRGTRRHAGNGSKGDEVDNVDENEEEEQRYKEDKFRNSLRSYAERLVSIVEDELGDYNSEAVDDNDEDVETRILADVPNQEWQRTEQRISGTFPQWTTSNRLFGWIENEYGIDKTQQVMADALLKKSEKEQIETFQTFLNWFRSIFPYFHDKCDACGASCKDDPVHVVVNGISECDDSTIEHQDVDHSYGVEQNDEQSIPDDFSCLGYVRPTPSELLGGASRTELYRCRSCLSYTRFPRYNKALWVTTTRRGRCGEYSMLLFRMLRALGYAGVRWCVDWADHVWVEVWLGNGGVEEDVVNHYGRWVHLDPCEAAVDAPLLYESWGKNQTYIVAFHDPFYSRSGDRAMCVDLELSGDNNTAALVMAAYGPQVNSSSSIEPIENEIGMHRFPPVEDVTRQYTSDEVHVIVERRGIGEEPVARAIKEVSANMIEMLQKLS